MVASRRINGPTVRLTISLQGAVQGMGFRPFIYRLANALEIPGQVRNTPDGVVIDIESTKDKLQVFENRILKEISQLAHIQNVKRSYPPLIGYHNFKIASSQVEGNLNTHLLPDIATCKECLAELSDPKNRRYRYPFTACTDCGPRFSIIADLPYDRPYTTMAKFTMCEKCRAEYANPLDRRFHAQSIACPLCGPQIALWDRHGSTIASKDGALIRAEEAIRQGKIIAVKGVGGFQLITAAGNANSVKELRRRKNRAEKPFALLFPSLEKIRWFCDVSPSEERLLTSRQSPIVILERIRNTCGTDKQRVASFISNYVAPGNPNLGVMLPYSPLHHLLMRDLDIPVVATSGNISGEPICIDEKEAILRLCKVADLYLVHDCPIIRPVDDSVVRIVAGREMVLRRARGYAPMPVFFNTELSPAVSTGAHMKNTIAISMGKNVIMSQHIGDLESPQAYLQFRQTIYDFQRLYGAKPKAIICDKHPNHSSSHFVDTSGLPVIRVQHHYAHIRSCMAENVLAGNVLGVAWDGTGYGDDGSIWGGEFLKVVDCEYSRIASIQPYPLPGNERAIREPRRTALGLLYNYFGDEIFEWMWPLKPLKTFSSKECEILRSMLEKKLNTPLTSSVGRLFDAVAAILGLSQISDFEGQAAMKLEFAIAGFKTNETYHFLINESDNLKWDIPLRLVNLKPMLTELLSDIHHSKPIPLISAKFHNTLVEMILTVSRISGEDRVVLSGGCFQNKYLTELTIARLLKEGFKPFWHKHVPPNDGGISLGQIGATGKLLDSSL